MNDSRVLTNSSVASRHPWAIPTEADAIGLRFAARAGYDPRAGASFWRKMAAKSGGGAPLKWLSTHPPSGERILNLERLAVPLMPVYEAAKAREGK